MIPALMGLPGKVRTLIDRLTAARAANLDEITAERMARLDMAISASKPVRRVQAFTASGVWVRPPGVDPVQALLVGAGGGGGGIIGGAYNRASGGGGGGQVLTRDLVVTGDLTITIGAGGLGGDSTPTNGADGGNSSLSGGAELIAYGGTGGGFGGTTSRYGNNGYGNTGGGGAGSSSTMVLGGSGGGASRAAHDPDNMSSFVPGRGGLSSKGHNGSAASSQSRDSLNHPGPGLNGFGGGGVGGVSRYPNQLYQYIGGSADGGGFGNAEADGGDAEQNTGGGGGGTGARTSHTVGHRGGNGADGICILTWWE